MKSKFLSVFLFAYVVLLIVGGTASAVVKVDDNNFPDPVFKKYVLEKIDVGGTGLSGEGEESGDKILSDAEIESVLTINLSYYNTSYRGIEDLTGIKYFTRLQTLNVDYQSLKALNVSGLTSLSTLRCDGNKLTFLSLEGCTALSTLSISYNKLSGELDLRELTSLSYLNCEGNSELSVLLRAREYGEIGFQTLKCSGVKSVGPLDPTTLTPHLDTLRCNNMTGSTLEEIDISNAHYLSVIDVSGNPNLKRLKWNETIQGMTFASLRELDISGTQISPQAVIDTISQRSGRPERFSANSMIGGLTELDLSAMTGLHHLHIASNDLTSVTFPESAGSYVYIYVDYNRLTSFPSLPKKTVMLDISHNALTSIKAERFAKISDDFRELDASDNNITEADFTGLTGLEELNLSRNALSAITLPVSMDVGYFSNGLKLELSRNKFTTMPAMPRGIYHLDMSGNSISVIGVLPLSIRYLDVSSNDLSVLDVRNLTVLEELYAGKNNLTALDMTANTNLHFIAVDYNKNMTTLNLTGLEGIKRVDISGTKVPFSSVPKQVYHFYADAMEYNLGVADLRDYKDLYSLHISKNGDGLTGLLLAPNEAGASRLYYATDNALTSINVPAGACWLRLDNNLLVSLDLSASTHLEEATLTGQKPRSTYNITQSNGAWRLSMSSVVGTSGVSKILSLKGYDSADKEIAATYSNGVAAFNVRPSKVKYVYDTDATIYTYGAGENSKSSMDVTITVADDSDDPDDPAKPSSPDVTANVDQILSMTDAQKQAVKSLKITGQVTSDLSTILEGMTNLVSLDLSETQIETVNLPDTSTLKTVNLKGNAYVKTVDGRNSSGDNALESLNLEGSSVETVNTDGFRNLKELNVSGCMNLRELSCVGNSLMALDLEGLPSLIEASFSGQTRRGVTLSTSMSLYSLISGSALSASNYDARAAWSAGKVKNLKAFDASGNEISSSYDSSTGTMTFASTPARFSYDYDTGWGSNPMDVTVTGTGGQDEQSEGVSASSGGCDSGLSGLAAMMSLAFLFYRKK